ncbi:MAG: TraU family protein [Methylococcaceae bacterium]|nr:TraU family protein [Methylococcaceae bacterium]
MNKNLLTLLISVSLMTAPFAVYAKNFTSVKVIKSAHSYSCLDYKILPNPCVYLYLSCSLFGGCGFKLAFRDRIRHKLPDLVVSSFKKPGDNPYTEIRLTASKAAKLIMDTTLTKAFDNNAFDGAEHENALVSLGAIQTKNNLRFNENNVVGSPAANVIRNTMKYTVPSIMGGPFLCKSTSVPLKPYFMSELDAIAWRKAELNLADVVRTTPLSREIGSLSGSNLTGNTWGAVIPRVGFVHQTEPVKASAVIAQRAIDLVTQPNQFPHIYTPYGYTGVRMFPAPPESYECGDGDGEQGPIFATCMRGTSFAQWMRAANEHSKSWQMITPKESSQCIAFGSSDVKWGHDKNAEDGDYAWNYWRQYECCKPGPGILLNP